MPRVTAQFTMSLDGFIAGPNDDDEIQIDLAPVLLGAGIRLFDQLEHNPISLEILRVVEGEGVTHLMYRVVKEG